MSKLKVVMRYFNSKTSTLRRGNEFALQRKGLLTLFSRKKLANEPLSGKVQFIHHRSLLSFFPSPLEA
jgi:hypothetical protein